MSPRKLVLMGLSAFAIVLLVLVMGLSASHQPREAWPTTLEIPSTRGVIGPQSLAEGEAGHLSLLIPGFTHCPDICPLSIARLQMAWQRLDDASRARLHPLFLTLDPARDSLPVLARYLSAFSMPVTGLRLAVGDDASSVPSAQPQSAQPQSAQSQPAQSQPSSSHPTQSGLAQLTERLGIQYHLRSVMPGTADATSRRLPVVSEASSQKSHDGHAQGRSGDSSDDGMANYMVDHSVAIFVIDEQGRLRDTLPLSQTPAQLADRLALLLKEAQQVTGIAPSDAPIARQASVVSDERKT